MEQIIMDIGPKVKIKPLKKKLTPAKVYPEFKYDKSITACFTGHRPGKKISILKFKNKESRDKLKESIKVGLLEFIKEGYSVFVTGMAIGSDLLFAEAVLELKQNFTHLKLVGAIPCVNQTEGWEEIDKKTYNYVLSKLDDFIYVNRDYCKSCMLERNRYMVENSSLVIAIWNGSCNGGTFYTIKYARKLRKKVVVLNERKSKFETLTLF